jgi:hypothetical protein
LGDDVDGPGKGELMATNLPKGDEGLEAVFNNPNAEADLRDWMTKPIMHIRYISIEDKPGMVGLSYDGTINQVVADPKDSSKRELKWISDCALFIDIETSANNVTEFTFRDEGARTVERFALLLQPTHWNHGSSRLPLSTLLELPIEWVNWTLRLSKS